MPLRESVTAIAARQKAQRCAGADGAGASLRASFRRLCARRAAEVEENGLLLRWIGVAQQHLARAERDGEGELALDLRVRLEGTVVEAGGGRRDGFVAVVGDQNELVG